VVSLKRRRKKRKKKKQKKITKIHIFSSLLFSYPIDIAFDKPANIIINGVTLLKNDQPKLNVRCRSIKLDIQPNKYNNERITIECPIKNKNSSTRVCTINVCLLSLHSNNGPSSLWHGGYSNNNSYDNSKNSRDDEKILKQWNITFRPSERRHIPPNHTYDEPKEWHADTGVKLKKDADFILEDVPSIDIVNRHTSFFLQKASHLSYTVEDNLSKMINALHWDAPPPTTTTNNSENEEVERNVVMYTRHQPATTGTVKSRGTTPLHVACKNGRLNSVNILLKYFAKTSIQDQFGATPLHHSAYSGNIQLVNKFVNSGTSVVMAQDNNQELAADYALNAASDIEKNEGYPRNSSTSLKLKQLYNIAALLESKAHTSFRVCHVTYMGM
jgi:hypothetical protein